MGVKNSFLSMFRNNGRNGHKGNDGPVDFEDLTVNDVKALYPGMTQEPLVNSIMDSSNPGMQIIRMDGDLMDMLKVVYLEDLDTAMDFAAALQECSENLFDEEGEPIPESFLRVEWVKWQLALRCSVKGRFVDTYKQIVTGVLTNSMSERGWERLSMPIGGTRQNKELSSGNRGNKRF